MNKRLIIRISVMVMAAFLLLLVPTTLTACPTCKNALHQNGAATGYAISILFMMIMPFAIFTFWTVLILRLRRKMATVNSENQAEVVLPAS